MSEFEIEKDKRGSKLDVEIKDAKLIFTTVWKELEDELGLENLHFPKEIILLGGAPGSGKGTNTDFIMKARGFTCPPIVVSSLLNSPEAIALKDAGQLVGDKEVVKIILRTMLEEEYQDGAVLDGFPRSRIQVECMKRLVKKMSSLNRHFTGTDKAKYFRRPTIHVMVLYVDEKTSIERQLSRGRETAQYNEEVKATGIGELLELRATDLDVDAARHRYRVFKEDTWDALESLREVFFYHHINAQGSLAEVEQNILRELKYQSSLELEPGTFDAIRHIPLASEIVLHARQELVHRLDGYAREHRELFEEVIDLINHKFMPIIQRHAIAGQAAINNEDKVLHDPVALAMLIDIFSDRGYDAVVDKQLSNIPVKFDLETGAIQYRSKVIYRIRIYFEGWAIHHSEH